MVFLLGINIWSEDLMAGSTLTLPHLNIDIMDY